MTREDADKEERRRLRKASRADADRIVREEQARLLDLIRRLPLDARAKVQGDLVRALFAEPFRVATPKGELLLAGLGEKSLRRGINLLTKQSATISWIDAFHANGVFWDVGANIGPYTLYAALRSDLRVVAFEPAAVNYFLLASNCELNAFGERVECLPFGLGDGRSVQHLRVSQFEPARSFGFRADSKRVFDANQTTLIFSIDQLIDEYRLPAPNYIKVDVPDMTEAIIAGSARTLRRPELKELHIEAGEDPGETERIVDALARAGFGVAARHTRGEIMDLTFARTTLGAR